MATATAESGTATVHDRVLQIFGKDGFLKEHNVERDSEIELLALAVLGSVDLLFLGEPGVGKTYLLEMFTKYGLKDAKLYNHMIFKESGIEELVGPRSIQAMKQDEIRRITEGFLPEADTAVIDEIFKGSASVLNAMLDLFASRTLKIGGKALDCSQLVTILMASNELPTSEDLLPFRDRLGMATVVEPVKTAEGRKRVRQIQLGQIASGIVPTVEPLTKEELAQARAEVDTIELPEPVGLQLDKAQEDWLKAEHGPSQRRMKQMYKVVKAHAWLRGAAIATSDDLMPCQHMAWNRLEDRDSARKVIMQFAGAFTRKANSLKVKLDPILAQMDQVRTELSGTQDKSDRRELFNKQYDATRELRGLEKEAEGLRDKGNQQGQDVSDLDAMLAEMTKAREFAEKMLLGDDPEAGI